jgi:RNA polymerase sigma-70 factor (ECF subfamily)
MHAVARDFASTDWRGIARLYDRLDALAPSPVVALNRAVAVAMNAGFEAGLAEIDRIADDGVLSEYPALHGARADLLRRLGRLDEAATAYRRGLALAGSGSERRFFEKRYDELRAMQPALERKL